MQNESTPENQPIKAISTSARRNARRYALQALYQWQLTRHPMVDVENEFINYHIDKQIDLPYFKELIHGVQGQHEAIDCEIKPFIGRAFSEIDPIELSVLRLSIYELLHRPDVPYRVIINEALELTKKFGSVEGFKFVNGVLDRIAKKLRATEISMRK